MCLRYNLNYKDVNYKNVIESQLPTVQSKVPVLLLQKIYTYNIRVLWRSRTNKDIRRYIKEDLLWEFAYMIMKAGKFHDLLSANWRIRKAGGIVQSESTGLRMRGTTGISP